MVGGGIGTLHPSHLDVVVGDLLVEPLVEWDGLVLHHRLGLLRSEQRVDRQVRVARHGHHH